MNKKIAALLFAMGLGVTASPLAFASCQGDCYRAYKACIADGIDQASCLEERDWCYASCAGG